MTGPWRLPGRRRVSVRPSIATGGFAYAALLIVLAGMALGALQVTESIRVARQREAEHQLLFVGRQYRVAIARYTARDAGPLRGPPRTLGDLLSDTRLPVPTHDLRRLYPDPMTGRVDWDLVRDARGGIVGVRSRSRKVPLQTARFAAEEAGFAKARTYADWVFAPNPANVPSSTSAAGRPEARSASPKNGEPAALMPARPPSSDPYP